MSDDSRPDTLLHIHRVAGLLQGVRRNLDHRARAHDASKLVAPEKEAFDHCTRALARAEYGSQEYDDAKARLGDALAHHYAVNDHHPEHYTDGVAGMSLMAVMEMLADWKAAVERAKDGSLERAIEINAERFDLSPDLVQVLFNTARELDWLDGQ